MKRLGAEVLRRQPDGRAAPACGTLDLSVREGGLLQDHAEEASARGRAAVAFAHEPVEDGVLYERGGKIIGGAVEFALRGDARGDALIHPLSPPQVILGTRSGPEDRATPPVPLAGFSD